MRMVFVLSVMISASFIFSCKNRSGIESTALAGVSSSGAALTTQKLCLQGLKQLIIERSQNLDLPAETSPRSEKAKSIASKAFESIYGIGSAEYVKARYFAFSAKKQESWIVEVCDKERNGDGGVNQFVMCFEYYFQIAKMDAPLRLAAAIASGRQSEEDEFLYCEK